MNRIDSATTRTTTFSRVQTAKMRKTLEKTLKNVRIKRSEQDFFNNCLNRPTSTNSNLLSNRQPKSRPYSNTKCRKFENLKDLKETKENIDNLNIFQKTKLSEIQIQNLFTEKLRDKNNEDENEIKKITYKKLIMRAKLLKGIKKNIVLKERQFEKYIEKYSSGNVNLEDKIKYRNNIYKRKKNKNKNKNNESDEDEISDIEIKDKKPVKPDFNAIKRPELFSSYELSSRFQDFYCTPLELLKKIFTKDEQNIINLDPIFFRLNRSPFNGVQENLRFNLKDKLNEEEKIERAKKQKKTHYYPHYKTVKNKRFETNANLKLNLKNFSNFRDFKNIKNISKTKKHLTSKYNSIKNLNSIFDLNKRSNISNIKKKEMFKPWSDNNYMSNINININAKWDGKNLTTTDFKRKTQGNQSPDGEEEKIRDKYKKLSMEELFEVYNERKKSYLDDLSYNRKKSSYKFEQLRKKHCENLEEQKAKKDNLRQLILDIEENYRLFQK